MITNTYKYFTSLNEQNKWENTLQKHREIREYKIKESSDTLGPCS